MQHYLENLWKRAVKKQNNLSTTWNQEIENLYHYNISLENALQYLHFENPDLQTFLHWVTQQISKTNNINEIQTENVLTDADIQFWNKNGYIVIKNAIPEEDCIETQKAIWDFLEMNPNEPESWYR